MANLKSFYYPGEIVEKQDLRELDNDKSVITLIAAFTQEIVKGFEEEVEKRVVLFTRHAEKAKKEISVGDCVVFSRCKRNPRMFTTDAGSEIETVEIIAEGFKVISQENFDDITAGLGLS